MIDGLVAEQNYSGVGLVFFNPGKSGTNSAVARNELSFCIGTRAWLGFPLDGRVAYTELDWELWGVTNDWKYFHQDVGKFFNLETLGP